jgi:hypothetical protein
LAALCYLDCDRENSKSDHTPKPHSLKLSTFTLVGYWKSSRSSPEVLPSSSQAHVVLRMQNFFLSFSAAVNNKNNESLKNFDHPSASHSSENIKNFAFSKHEGGGKKKLNKTVQHQRRKTEPRSWWLNCGN